MARKNQSKTHKYLYAYEGKKAKRTNKMLENMSIEDVLENDFYGTSVGSDFDISKGGYVTNRYYTPLEELIYN